MLKKSLKIAARRSELSQIQARSVASAFQQSYPELAVEFIFQATQGDRDTQTPLANFGGKGAFTSDLTELLLNGQADIVVHSWKDLPIEAGDQTHVAATLARADIRDFLLIHKSSFDRSKSELKLLSSSPRREFLIGNFLKWAYPKSNTNFKFESVRGNIATRLRKFQEGQGDGLVIAKAAIDRALSDNTAEFEATRQLIRACIASSYWMVIPVTVSPCAPAQGALALEVRNDNRVVQEMCAEISSRSDFECVLRERELLAEHGGGCHLAIGTSVIKRDFGKLTVAIGKTPSGIEFSKFDFERAVGQIPRAQHDSYWPATRAEMSEQPAEAVEYETERLRNSKYLWIAKARALPENFQVTSNQILWSAGLESWRRLAARGVWVNGSSESLGEQEDPRISHILGEVPHWIKLSHAHANVGKFELFATYRLKNSHLPENIGAKTHFFWRSGSLFRSAVERFPKIAEAIHACGPGNTFEYIKNFLGTSNRLFVALTFESWLDEISPT